ncbi:MULTISPECIES: CaiB/BaiF CoA transferase family protein [Pseudofrankia]|uniref:CaiB/BaiF CoA transferase family protein n=1 Tax=Pseudofrankia TaxID=2994363 RepID=UPI000234D0BD|nr:MULTISPECIES: CoA transferase [Pseudofrankia]OHV34870.1 formyl-CoA transferase [Pseudofrankia sp. EUN1h]
MRLDDVGEARQPTLGRPLDGVRVLALEQMQAVPSATLLLARLGADVVKVEPLAGESGRGAQPAVTDPAGRPAGATFLRYNLGKRAIALDLKRERGRDLLLELAGSFDVVAENLGPGRADRLGVGYEAMAARDPRLIYLSVTGFGARGDSPYASWPAYAAVAEAMSGIYEYSRRPHQPPVINPVGGLGDNGSGLYGVIGVLAALRHRDRTGLGQLVDVAMFDAMVAICDVVANYWSLGIRPEPDTERRAPYLVNSFRARDGWCVVQLLRDHQFPRLAELLGHPEWLTDDRFATRWGWHDHWADVLCPALESWAADRSMLSAAGELAAVGVTAAPCFGPEDVVSDPHVTARRMLVEIPRTDGVAQPVLVAGNPVKLSRVPDEPEPAPPTLGQHTAELLTEVLGLDAAAIASLHEDGVIGLG